MTHSLTDFSSHVWSILCLRSTTCPICLRALLRIINLTSALLSFGLIISLGGSTEGHVRPLGGYAVGHVHVTVTMGRSAKGHVQVNITLHHYFRGRVRCGPRPWYLANLPSLGQASSSIVVISYHIVAFRFGSFLFGRVLCWGHVIHSSLANLPSFCQASSSSCWASTSTMLDIVLITIIASSPIHMVLLSPFSEGSIRITHWWISSHVCIHMLNQPVAAGSSFGWVLLIVGPNLPNACPLWAAPHRHHYRYVKDGTYCLQYDSKASTAKQHSSWCYLLSQLFTQLGCFQPELLSSYIIYFYLEAGSALRYSCSILFDGGGFSHHVLLACFLDRLLSRLAADQFRLHDVVIFT